MSAWMNCRRFHIHDSAAQSFSSLQSTVQRTWRLAYARGGSGARLLPGLVPEQVKSEQAQRTAHLQGRYRAQTLPLRGDYRFSEMFREITQSTLGINNGWLFAAKIPKLANFIDHLLSLVRADGNPGHDYAHAAVSDCNQPFQPARKSISIRLISSGFSSCGRCPHSGMA
jgi:hypothetical protein